jgi:hypothetical protein
MWNLVTVYLETLLEIVLDTADGTPRSRGGMWNFILVRLETLLVLAQDNCSVCAKHTIGLEIILDAPDGTRR